MTTKKNLVKSMFMNILTAGIFATAFTACSDDLSNEANGFNAPQDEKFEVMKTEQYSYAIPVNVDINGDWKAELKFENNDNLFCYLTRTEGHGPATIKLCMLDNWTEERNNGQLVITDLSNPDNSKVIQIEQKCNLDNPNYSRSRTRGEDGEEKSAENAEVKKEGHITTCVGYGYNVNMKPGSEAISSRAIIAIDLLKDKGAGYGPELRKGEFKINVENYAGNSITEVSNTMTASSTLKYTRGGFTAEANASFSNTQKSNSNNMFCLTVANVNVGQAVLQGIDRNNVREFMTPAAKQAIDGTGTAYQSNNDGFKDLIKHYGSHLILRTDLGGRLRYGATIDKQYCSSTSELKAHANMSYKNKLMDGNAKVGNDYSSTYSKTKSHIMKTVTAVGGGFKETADVSANDTTEVVNAWVQSLADEQNLAVINFSQSESQEMWPIYELVDRSTPAGQKRYEMLKDYMENGQMELDFCSNKNIYKQTTAVRIDFPSDWLKKANGKRGDIEGTLIREARHNGKTVAWLCMEYIPQISCEGLIPVVYPVINNKPNFQDGHFLGTDHLEACKVKWNADGTATPDEYVGKKGQQTTIWFYANTIFTFLPNENVENAEIRNKVLVGQKAKSDCCVTFGITTDDKEWRWSEGSYKRRYKNPWLEGLSYNNNYQYPLVKVGNQVWTRENYNGNVPHGKDQHNRYGSKIEKGEAFFTYTSLKNASFPAGWHTATATDYQSLRSTLSSDGVENEFGERMQEGGASGFNLKWNGWYTYKMTTIGVDALDQRKSYFYHNYELKGNGTAAEYMLPGTGHVRIRADRFDVCPKETDDFAMQIRLVMNL